MLEIFSSLKKAFSKTRSYLGSKLRTLFKNPLTEESFIALEQLLYESDIGSHVAEGFIAHVKSFLKKQPQATNEQIIHAMKQHALSLLCPIPLIGENQEKPQVFLIVGVNGGGKTTSIAKLSCYFKSLGKKVLLGAADTFRAAAIDQLSYWADKVCVDIVKSKPGSDPSSVAFDTLTAALARGHDIAIIDTAGRLHNKIDLMQELEKIRRTCHKVIAEAPHVTLLVIDATIGQNALDQARNFHRFTPINGIILSKLDGSAKGGVIFSIYQELKIPIYWVGVGEKATDFIPFNAQDYVDGLFDLRDNTL